MCGKKLDSIYKGGLSSSLKVRLENGLEPLLLLIEISLYGCLLSENLGQIQSSLVGSGFCFSLEIDWDPSGGAGERDLWVSLLVHASVTRIDKQQLMDRLTDGLMI